MTKIPQNNNKKIEFQFEAQNYCHKNTIKRSFNYICFWVILLRNV